MTEDKPPRPLSRRGKGIATLTPPLIAEPDPNALPLQERAAMEAGKDGSDKLLYRLRLCHEHGYGDYRKKGEPT